MSPTRKAGLRMKKNGEEGANPLLPKELRN
jgi:hypothetical protein